MASTLVRVAATGVIASGARLLKSVTLHGGSAASAVVVNDSTDGSGTNVLSFAALANDSRQWRAQDDDGVWCRLGIYVTLAGTGASVTVEFA